MRLTDARWSMLAGGYRIPYDPRPALSKLAANFADKSAWDELWNELHHQGNVGEASYAAVTALVDIYPTDRRADRASHHSPEANSSGANIFGELSGYLLKRISIAS